MKTSSACFRTYRDSQGVQRRQYHASCIDCGADLWVQRSRLQKTRRCKPCASQQGLSSETRKKIGDSLRKKYQTDPEFKERVSKAKVVKKGGEHWNWKGGMTPFTQRTRTSQEANAWKLAVFHRDNFLCRICSIGENLQAHHINSWASYPEDRFILENGLTLCKSCHTFYHQYEKEVRRNVDISSLKKK